MVSKWILFSLMAFSFINASAQQNIEGNLKVEDQNREFLVHLPSGYQPGRPAALVLVFHGGGGNAAQIQRYMNLDRMADQDGIITVYPQGLNKQWNDGREFRETITANNDVRFIDRLLDQLIKTYSIDTTRIFSTGISNGGFFSIYLSWKLAHRILAVAPVCASIPEKILPEFHPARPVSVLLMNGTQDPLVPYEGGEVGNRFTGSRGKCSSTSQTIERFLNINECKEKPVVDELPNTNKTDGCRAVRYSYASGLNNSRVILIKVNGGGHTLPGGIAYLPKWIVGRVCRDFLGNEMIWDFFKSCPPRN